MSTGEIVLLIIGLLVAAFGVWRFLPRSLFFFSPGMVRSWFGLGAELKPDKMEKAAEHIGHLSALGYRPAGVLYEKPPLWSKPVEVLILADDRREKEFACIIVTRRRVTYYFQTLFSDGQVVITADGGFRPVNEGKLYQTLEQSDEPGDILERHRKNVEHYTSEGNMPLSRYTDDIIGDSTRNYYSLPVVQRGMRSYGGMNSFVLALCCIPLIFALV